MTHTQSTQALTIATAYNSKQIKAALRNPKNSVNFNQILLEALSIKKEKRNGIFAALFCFLFCNLLNLPLLSLIFEGYNLGAAIGAAIFSGVFLMVSLALLEEEN